MRCKRDTSRFLGSLAPDERRELIESLHRTYRDLLVSYFSDPAASNQALESFVNTAFFSDLPITRTVEIHVNLIDEFWKQRRKIDGLTPWPTREYQVGSNVDTSHTNVPLHREFRQYGFL